MWADLNKSTIVPPSLQFPAVCLTKFSNLSDKFNLGAFWKLTFGTKEAAMSTNSVRSAT